MRICSEDQYKVDGVRLWHSLFDIEMLNNPKTIWEGQAPFSETLSLLDSYGYELLHNLPHDKIFVLKA